jgi:ectoine hydroxylase-related dioxygenase (phytanoyl-CoA dioxygenase family)
MTALQITAEHMQQYRDAGYIILERVLPDEHLQIFREELAAYIEYIHHEMDRAGTDNIGISHRHKRYFIMNRHEESGRLRQVLFSDYMAMICQATIGDDAYLLNEQFAVKCNEPDTAFSWHQDSGYVNVAHRPWVTCWFALDDMSEANGTIYVLPYSRAGVRKRVPHVRQQGSNDMVGYYGSDPGEPVVVPAGSIVAFSSVTFHRSGPNITDEWRRAFTAEYTSEPSFGDDPPEKWGLFRPFLKGGRRAAQCVDKVEARA